MAIQTLTRTCIISSGKEKEFYVLQKLIRRDQLLLCYEVVTQTHSRRVSEESCLLVEF